MISSVLSTLPFWLMNVHHKVLSIIAGKAAEILLSTIKKVGQNLGKSK